MKILQNDGKYEFLYFPQNVVDQIAEVARTCYKSVEDEKNTNKRLVEGLMRREHLAMIEHAYLTVKFTGISRGFTHEQVRHRLTSPAQQSTRYVDKSDFHFVIPPGIDKDKEDINVENSRVDLGNLSVSDIVELYEGVYGALLEKGWPKEDARQFLPIGIEAPIVITANLREWRHIFEMRCDKPAHWEIREVMIQLLQDLQSKIPIIFDDFRLFETPPDKDKKDHVKWYMRKVLRRHKLLDAIDHYNNVSVASEQI